MKKLRYMLDTNICIYLMNGAPPSVIDKFAQCKRGEVSLSAITWSELCCGMDEYHAQDEMMLLFESLAPVDFDMKAATIFGKLSRQFPSRKSSFDRLIAAHALSLDVILVTNNIADFSIYQSVGLKLDNWV